MEMACAKVLLTLSLLSLSQAASPAKFNTPPSSKPDQSEKYTIGETVQLDWDSHIDNITLTVVHWLDEQTSWTLLDNVQDPSKYNWTIGQDDTIDDDEIAKGPQFVLQITDPTGEIGDDSGYANNTLWSRLFIIESNNTTSDASSPSTTPPSSSTALAASSTPSRTPESKKSDLSAGAKAGLGIGATALVLILVLIGALLTIFIKRRSKKQLLHTPRSIRDGFYMGGVRAPTFDAARIVGPKMSEPELEYLVQPMMKKFGQRVYESNGGAQR